MGLSPFKTWAEQSFEPLPGDLHRHPVVNCYNTDSGLLGHWKDFPGAHIGPEHSITDVPLDKLEDSEGLVAGPPCQPFSPAGQRHGTSDARSVPFDSCVDCRHPRLFGVVSAGELQYLPGAPILEHAVGWDAKEPAEVQGHGIPV